MRLKIFLSLILLVVSFLFPFAYAQDEVLTDTSNGVYVTREPQIISSKIEKELKSNIAKVYGSENVDEIYAKILEIAKLAKSKRSDT